MTPTSKPLKVVFSLEAKGRPVRSTTGKASMSALRATKGPGLSPLSIAIKPVLAMPVFTSKPKEFKCFSIYLAVLNSRLDNSGYWCRCCRQVVIFFKRASDS